MDGTIACLQRWSRGADESAEGVVERVGGQCGVEPRQRVAQTLLQHHLAEVAALGGELAWCDLRAVLDRVAEALQPVERGVFNDGFGEPAHAPRLLLWRRL